MKRKLPKRNRDLKIYVLRRKLLQLSAYLLWLAAFFGSALAYNAAHQTYIKERLITGWRLVLWMLAAAVIGFLIFRIHRLLLDRSFEGEVIRSELSHTYEASADPGFGKPMSYDFRLNTYLIVRTENGKKRRIRFEQKPGFYLYYYEGNRVYHFAGLPYPVRDPRRICQPPRRTEGAEDPFDDLSGGVICAACGFMNARADVPCGRCMHSLIDPELLWGENGAEESDIRGTEI